MFGKAKLNSVHVRSQLTFFAHTYKSTCSLRFKIELLGSVFGVLPLDIHHFWLMSIGTDFTMDLVKVILCSIFVISMMSLLKVVHFARRGTFVKR